MAYDDQELAEILTGTGSDDEGDEGFGDEPEAFDEAWFGEAEQLDTDDVEELEGYDDFEGFETFGIDDDQVLTPQEEEALAFELMSVTSEAELEQFLGNLFKKVKKGVSKVARRVRKKIIPSAAKFIKGTGRKLLAKALPMIGSAVGTAFAPGAGTQIGGAAGSVLGSLLGGAGPASAPAAAPPGLPGGGGLGALLGMLGGGGGNPLAQLLGSGAAGNLLGSLIGGEMEGATLEEAKLDLSKRMVRTVSQATKDAVIDPRAAVDPRNAAKIAMGKAVRRHIPMGVRQVLAASAAPAPSGAAAGQWVRRGNQIVLLGA